MYLLLEDAKTRVQKTVLAVVAVQYVKVQWQSLWMMKKNALPIYPVFVGTHLPALDESVDQIQTNQL